MKPRWGLAGKAARAVMTTKIIPERSVTKTAKSTPRELQRYQTLFVPKIKGMDPLEKFNLLKFTLYNGKSDLMSHINHFRQMMAL